MSVRVIHADVFDGLAQLGDGTVHCCVTSPPYWGLRDYGYAGQIGLEPTLAEHIAKLVEVFRCVRRVLRDDGTLWLNYGDGYASSPPGNKDGVGATSGLAGAKSEKYRETLKNSVAQKRNTAVGGMKPKDLLMMPERLAIALQDDGWWVRSRIIWAKPNPMPESVTDRPTKSHEHVWLMSKAPRYYYDAEAIKEASEYPDDNRKARATETQKRMPSDQVSGTRPGSQTYALRNARDVWTIATEPYPEGHFATMPTELARRCILAGTSAHGCCAKCGAPWMREVEHGETLKRTAVNGHGNGALNKSGRFGDAQRLTAGWAASCACEAPTTPCTVLDIFGGAGTTGLVADRLQRRAILIEASPDYVDNHIAPRIAADRGPLLDLMEPTADLREDAR